MPHVIRLDRPWQLIDWNDRRLRVVRKFHRPTGLVLGQQVCLSLDCTEGVKLLQASLNGIDCLASIAQESSFRRSIESELISSNQLEVCLQVAAPGSPQLQDLVTIANPQRLDLSSWLRVRLEIMEEPPAEVQPSALG
jgi:hypothetical protein